MEITQQHAFGLITALHPQPSASTLIEITGLMRKAIPAKRYLTDPIIASEAALEWNARGYSVFVNVNPRKAMAGFERDVAFVSALPLDLQPERTDIAGVMSMLARYGIAASIQASSGHGAHAYVLLRTPVDPLIAKPVCERLCKVMGSDPIFNTNRIMRLPGSVNWKSPPRWCYLTDYHPERRYELDEVVAALDAMGAPKVKYKGDVAPIEATIEKETVEGAELALRELTPYAYGLVQYGERAPGAESTQPTRSETDWMVVCSLVRVGATDEMIFYIYQTNEIGNLKYRSAGDRYLSRTIEAARRTIAAVEHEVVAGRASHASRRYGFSPPRSGAAGNRRAAGGYR